MAKFTIPAPLILGYGLCQCGCGQKTKIAKKTSVYGVAGEPNRFIRGHAVRVTNFTERFVALLKRDEKTGCLNFTGPMIDKRGYGWVYFDYENHPAHRVAWILSGREIPDGMNILHNCPAGDNPACCEVSHLRAGTQAENADDMARKSRGRKSKIGLPYGVTVLPAGRFAAAVWFDGKRRHLGVFDTIDEAAGIAIKEKIRLRGLPVTSSAPTP